MQVEISQLGKIIELKDATLEEMHKLNNEELQLSKNNLQFLHGINQAVSQ